MHGKPVCSTWGNAVFKRAEGGGGLLCHARGGRRECEWLTLFKHGQWDMALIPALIMKSQCDPPELYFLKDGHQTHGGCTSVPNWALHFPF